MAERLVCYQTWIEHKGVWVSTVAWDIPIGVGRCAETGVFRGDGTDIWYDQEVYTEGHGWETDPVELWRKHCEIVEKVIKGEIVVCSLVGVDESLRKEG